MRENRKKHFIILLFIVVLLTIGFAVLSTNLTLSGTGIFAGNSWKVKMQNIEVDPNSTVSGTQSISNDTTVSLTTTLTKPGDFYAFTVDAVNTGSIDAMVSSVSKSSLTEQEAKLLDFYVVYSDGTDIIQYDKLGKNNGTEKILVLVCYKLNISNEDIPSEAVEINLSFTINYAQADDNAKSKESQYVYSVSTTMQNLGETLPSITTYSSYSSAVSAFGHPFFLKHKLVNNVIDTTYVGFVYDSKVYYFKGSTSDYTFSLNKYLVSSIFDDDVDICDLGNIDPNINYSCFSRDSYLGVEVDDYSGEVFIQKMDMIKRKLFMCAYSEGTSACETMNL